MSTTLDSTVIDKMARAHRQRPRRPLALGFSAVVVAVVLFVVVSFAEAPKMDWATYAKYLFNDAILKGLLTTVQLTVIGMLLATALGTMLALMATSRSKLLRFWAAMYAWFFRGVPLIVQLLLWYNLAVVFPTIRLPFVEVSTNDLISAMTASLLGLALHEAAYMSEVIRAGLLSVPKGQVESGLAMGLTHGQVQIRIVIPQALRIIVPPFGNQFISLLKASSLVAVIGGGELLTRAQYIYGQNFAVIPLLLVATTWYLALTSIASVGLRLLETRLDPARTVPRARRTRWRPLIPRTSNPAEEITR